MSAFSRLGVKKKRLEVNRKIFPRVYDGAQYLKTAFCRETRFAKIIRRILGKTQFLATRPDNSARLANDSNM